jgi:hypothetical protein
MKTITNRRALFDKLKKSFFIAKGEFSNIRDVINSGGEDKTLSEWLHSNAQKAISKGESIQDYLSSLKFITDKLPKPTRRELFKIAGLSGIIGATAYLYGCGLSKEYVKKDQEFVKNTKWDANPAIPVPKDGCYAGFFVQTPNHKKLEEGALEMIQKITGYFPSVQLLGISHIAILDDNFPFDSAREAVRQGVIPALSHAIMPPNFEDIGEGKQDRLLESLAKKIKEFDNPMFFIPYKEINGVPWGPSALTYRGTTSGRTFVKAWRRMYKIFEMNGANEKTVWSTHFLASTIGREQKGSYYFPSYYPGDEFVDWVGFTVGALPFMYTTNDSLTSIFGSDYKYCRKHYPNKPIAIWEFGGQENSYQPRWITKSFKSMKEELPGIKAFTYYYFSWHLGSTSLTPEAMKAYKKAISDPYFIKGPEKLKL